MDRHISVWKYEGIVRKGVHALKYRFASDIADEFIGYIDCPKFFTEKSLLIPIPMHQRKEKWRGFNQSALLASKIAKKFEIVCAENLLIKTQNTIPQAQLGRKQRLQNISGKFAVNDQFISLIPHHKSLILVDDVWTTGSTMKEACKVLKKAGASKVWGFTLAS